VARDQLTIHADRGASMASRPVAFLLADLGVTKSHSRPHVSNDNAYSESQFKTLKYRPEFSDHFGSYEDGHQFCTWFFGWYRSGRRSPERGGDRDRARQGQLGDLPGPLTPSITGRNADGNVAGPPPCSASACPRGPCG
jgi:transposase InsO family protein